MRFEPLRPPQTARRYVLTREDILAQRASRPRVREAYDGTQTGAASEITITTGRKQKTLIKPAE